MPTNNARNRAITFCIFRGAGFVARASPPRTDNKESLNDPIELYEPCHPPELRRRADLDARRMRRHPARAAFRLESA
ncbi:hypothetical protein PT2222_10012 [Paraburkholderia tropica]